MINLHELYEMKIDDLSYDGTGVGKVDGFAVFTGGALPGDCIETRITKLNTSYGYGELVRVISPSPDRTEPQCAVSELCGGCPLQQLDYARQLDLKTRMVENTLKRIGGLEDVVVHEAVGMNQPLFYRNKAQFPVGMVNGKARIGYYAKSSHDVIPIDRCAVLPPVTAQIIRIVNKYFDDYGVTAYDRASHKGLVRHIMVRDGRKTGEIMVCAVINGQSLPAVNALIEPLSAVEGMTSICLNINTKRTSQIFGKKTVCLWGNDCIYDYLCRLKFQISPLSFFQINPVQAEVLYQKALELAAPNKNSTVIDAYCGIGTISLFFAANAGKVIGIEISGQAVKDAKQNALLNNITNAEFIAGRAETILNGILAGLTGTDTILILDPPRSGCEKSLLDAIIRFAPKKVIYISCNVATLARDLKYLTSLYSLTNVYPVDMFPMTPHIECVTSLSI